MFFNFWLFDAFLNYTIFGPPIYCRCSYLTNSAENHTFFFGGGGREGEVNIYSADIGKYPPRHSPLFLAETEEEYVM